MRFIRDALGGAIALCLACLVVLVTSPSQPPASAFRGEPPPDGGTAALGAPDPTAVVNETVRGSIRSLRQLASEEPTIAPAFNVYASTLDGSVDPRVAAIPPRVYVPNSTANTVDVIDPLTFQVVDHFRVGSIPHPILGPQEALHRERGVEPAHRHRPRDRKGHRQHRGPLSLQPLLHARRQK